MTRRTMHIVAVVAGLGVLAVAGMFWFRPRCTPETCGFHVGNAIRELMTRQEMHHAEHGAYATSFEELGPFPLEPAVIELIYTSPAGWVARGTHPELEGMSCIAWMGTVPSVPPTDRWGLRADREERQLACDFPI